MVIFCVKSREIIIIIEHYITNKTKLRNCCVLCTEQGDIASLCYALPYLTWTNDFMDPCFQPPTLERWRQIVPEHLLLDQWPPSPVPRRCFVPVEDHVTLAMDGVRAPAKLVIGTWVAVQNIQVILR